MSPGVLGNEGERYQRPGRARRPPRVTLDSAACCRPGVDTGSRRTSAGAAGARRGESGHGATDSRNHRRGSTGVPGRVHRGRRRRGSPERSPRPRRPRAGVARRRRRLDRRLARRCRSRSRSPTASSADVTVVDGGGAEVAGTVADAPEQPGAAVWTPEAPLAYGTSYTLTAIGDERRRRGGRRRPRRSPPSPRPRCPRRRIGPLDGRPSGSACRSASTSTTRSPTRPPSRATSWSPAPPPPTACGTGSATPRCTSGPRSTGRRTPRSRLDANLYGVDFGDGIWGEKNRTVSFSIGAKHVSDRRRRHPHDAGLRRRPAGPDLPDQRRQPGQPELQRRRTWSPSSTATGSWTPAPTASRSTVPTATGRPVEYAVRISDSGEFVHAAPWSVAQQGNTNVSHGCINMSTERAAWFFNFSQPGRRRGDPQLHRRRPALATSTTGPSRGTSGRPAAR